MTDAADRLYEQLLVLRSQAGDEAALPLYAAMARWLIHHQPRPVIIVDWSELKANGSLHLLRAAIPIGGRTLTVFEAIYSERKKNSPPVERQFLKNQSLLRL